MFVSLSSGSAGDRTRFSASRGDNGEEDDLWVWIPKALGQRSLI